MEKNLENEMDTREYITAWAAGPKNAWGRITALLKFQAKR